MINIDGIGPARALRGLMHFARAAIAGTHPSWATPGPHEHEKGHDKTNDIPRAAPRVPAGQTRYRKATQNGGVAAVHYLAIWRYVLPGQA
jgi:hypothetical protein